jgi:2-keto-4-pentenoate hydratase/2-oxohepta-3-ene-1,7-dioic acid hydratase in catechol pathway
MVDTAEVKFWRRCRAGANARFSCFEKHSFRRSPACARRARRPPPIRCAARDAVAGTYNAEDLVRAAELQPSRFAVCGTDQDVVWPAYSKTIDYELEFACVIGKTGRNIPRTRPATTFSANIFNDLSARDEQSQEMLSSLGPVKARTSTIPTDRSLHRHHRRNPHPYVLDMIVRVNGRNAAAALGANGLEYED